MWKSRVIVLAACTVMASGCTAAGQGQSPGASSGTPSSAAVDEVRILALAKEVADCIRKNGLPGFPDPFFENGDLKLPPVDATVEQQGQALLDGVCHEQWQRLEEAQPEQKGDQQKEREAPHPMTPEEQAMLKNFTNCLREHGMPTMPDPDENGQYHLGAAGFPEGLGKGNRPEDTIFMDALRACESFNVSGSGFTN